MLVISGLFSLIFSACLSLQMPTGSEDDETCATFVLHEEDHTLGNSLRYIIMKKLVTSCGGEGVGHSIFIYLLRGHHVGTLILFCY